MGVNGGAILVVSWPPESWHQAMINLVPVEDLEKEDLEFGIHAHSSCDSFFEIG